MFKVEKQGIFYRLSDQQEADSVLNKLYSFLDPGIARAGIFPGPLPCSLDRDTLDKMQKGN